MLVVEPIKLTSVNTQTDAPIDDYPLWQPDTPTPRGERRIYNDKIYEAVKDGTTARPDDKPNTDPDWLYYGYINPLQLIDEFIETQTTKDGEMIIEVTPHEIFDTVALLNVDAAYVKFEILDSGEVWVDETHSLADVEVRDWWEYYFTEPKVKKEHIFTGFPATRVSSIRITLIPRGEDGRTAIGKLIVGRSEELGCARWGAEITLLNFSKIGRNDFGHITIIPRSSAKEAKFDVRIDTENTTYVMDILERIKDTPCLWVGEESYGLTAIYGIYDGYRTILRNRRFSSGVLYIKGFV